MCGIVYFNNKDGKSVNNFVRKAYKKQRNRGHEGFGFFTPNNNRLTHNTSERGILRLLGKAKQSEVLFHHRFPTSTNNVRNACHPFSTKDVFKHNYIMVHNGVIWNDYEVATEQKANCINYVSLQKDGRYNDSEVLMYDIASVIEGKKDSLDCEGSIAFIMVQLDKKGNRKALYFGRNSGNPLMLNKTAHGFSLTSEGDGVNIETNKLFRYDYKTKKFTSKYLNIPTHTYYATNTHSSHDYDERDWKWENEKYLDFDTNGNISGKYILPEKKPSLVFTEVVLERHKKLSKYEENLDVIDEAVSDVKNALLYDMLFCNDVAIEFGGYMFDEITVEYEKLENLISTENSKLTGGEVDRYLELDMQLELLRKAIDRLINKEVQSKLKLLA